MDSLQVNGDLQKDLHGQLLIKVQVNGKDFPEESNGVDLEMFFDAINSQKRAMRFVFGCGDFDCCGVTVDARSSTGCWEWKFEGTTLEIPWPDVERAVEVVITSVEQLSDDPFGFGPQYLDERLKYFRHKLSEVQALVCGEYKS